MGFKCPVCMEDFGRDKDKWKEHCEKEHKGIGKDIVDSTIRITTIKPSEELE